MADHFNNPVPDGTVVNFTANGGSVGSTCSTIAGACSSTLTSQAPRPVNGRVTVLAYAVGEESFIDLNSNGVADLLPFNEMRDVNGRSSDLGEAFRDDNENGVYDPASEPYIDFNLNGVFDGPDGKFSGVLCDNVTAPPVGSSLGTCAVKKSMHVRRSLVIIFSGSNAVITRVAALQADGTYLLTPTIDVAPCARQNFSFRVVDVDGNPMPAGTNIAVSTSKGSVSPSTFAQINSNVTTPATAIPPALQRVAGEDVTFSTTVSGPGTISPTTGLCVIPIIAGPGLLDVSVTTPGGAGVAPTTTIKQFAMQ
jgi:hypothetical protein